jgi:type IV pilus assembly protein PilC
MPKYIYEARNSQGQLVKGEVKAANETLAQKVLENNGLMVDKVTVQLGLPQVMSMFNRIGIKEKSRFSRQLATMINAGLPLVQALNIILIQTKNGNFKSIINAIIKDVESGFSFSSAIAKHPKAFNRVYVSIVKSGEATGKLDEVLMELADQQEKDATFSGKVKGALAYPIFIICAMVGVGVIMMIKVVPTVEEVFTESGAELPMATKILMALSHFLVGYWYLALGILVAIYAAIKLFLMTPGGKEMFDRFAIKVPVFSDTVISVMMSRLTRTLALLISSGIPILEAIQIVSEAMDNSVYRKGLERVRDQVERGVPMSVPIQKDKNFPILFGQMVAVGEQTGQVDAMLSNMARFFTEEAETKLKSITSLIEPLVMVILGVGVAFIIFAILVPIYNISSITN